MEAKVNFRLRLLSYVVIFYMLLAFTWWSVLLFTKNRDAFYAKRDLLRIGMVAEGLVSSDQEFLQSDVYLELQHKYRLQEWMILGEASVFVLSLVVGVWLINRGYNKEMTASQQRRNFLLSITHELKSPIASIRLILETLLKRSLPPEQNARLKGNALKETERLNNLVDNLLLSARLEQAFTPHYDELDLADLLQELIQKLNDKFPDAAFRLTVDPELPLIRADVSGLTSVALNLLENAIKYSAEPATIDIRLQTSGNQVVMEVADQGYGIREKEKKKIFEKFYRTGNEDTRRTKGTGLGLYIVDQIVRAHGGRIQVLDNQPQGTVFRVILPLNMPPLPKAQKKEFA